jgi:hypothetical protein
MKNRSYSELVHFDTFEDRFEYLKLGGAVGSATFGYDRWLNQRFYTSRAWRSVKQEIIIRDNGCDLGILGMEIHINILVHHMNPMTPEDISRGEEWIIDPEFLICTTKLTHNAIHYGTDKALPKVVASRSPNDTKLW